MRAARRVASHPWLSSEVLQYVVQSVPSYRPDHVAQKKLATYKRLRWQRRTEKFQGHTSQELDTNSDELPANGVQWMSSPSIPPPLASLTPPPPRPAPPRPKIIIFLGRAWQPSLRQPTSPWKISHRLHPPDQTSQGNTSLGIAAISLSGHRQRINGPVFCNAHLTTERKSLPPRLHPAVRHTTTTLASVRHESLAAQCRRYTVSRSSSEHRLIDYVPDGRVLDRLPTCPRYRLLAFYEIDGSSAIPLLAPIQVCRPASPPVLPRANKSLRPR